MTAARAMTAEEYRAATKPRRSKYGAEPTVVDGIRFDSKREAARWWELKLLEKAGRIVGLKRQEKFTLLGRNTQLRSASGRELLYIADFSYFDRDARRHIIEDVKGVETDVFKLKRAIMEAQGIVVQIVR